LIKSPASVVDRTLRPSRAKWVGRSKLAKVNAIHHTKDAIAVKRPLKKLLDRMPPPRRIGLALVVLVTGLSIWAILRGGPSLSPIELALVGKWGRAELDPGISFGTRARGPLTNPWLVQEFARDRTYRQWIVSADDPSHRFVHVEGRWRVIDGAIRIEAGVLGLRRPLDNARARIATMTGLPIASTSSVIGATRDISFRLVGPDDLEPTFTNQDRPEWRRLPTPLFGH
jgi:hypothetical protein